ncbi:MAG: TetR/AcrR family transcriptional regulator [Bacteroidales bacterium]
MEEFTKRQEEIITKAINIIDDKGIQGLTIKNLSKEIGVTEGAIYRHFENKQKILISILSRFAENMEELQRDVLNSENTTEGKISFTLHQLRGMFEKNPAIVSVIFAEEIFKNDKQLAKKITEIIHFNHDFFRQIISEGQKQREIRHDLDEGMIVNHVIGSFRLLVKIWKLEEFKVSLKNGVDDLLKYLKATIWA